MLFKSIQQTGPPECDGPMPSLFRQEERRHRAVLSILLAVANCKTEGKWLVFNLSCGIVDLEVRCFTSMGKIGT
jgi:hypothetical protein